MHILHSVLFLLTQGIRPFVIIINILLQDLFPLTHDLIRECIGTDPEIGSIISQRIIDLTVSDPVSHHDIGRRMGLREHVLDLLTGPDIPVRHAMLRHILLKLRPLLTLPFCHGSLTHTLHDGKGFLTVKPLVDKICHNIVTGTDSRGNGSLSAPDQLLCVIQPYVRSMRKTGNTDQIRKCLWLGIHYHLDNEVCSKLRDTKTPYRAAANVVRLDAKC